MTDRALVDRTEIALLSHHEPPVLPLPESESPWWHEAAEAGRGRCS